MPASPPFNLHRWIDENRALLKPPVGNKLLFQDSAFIVMAVGGPNARKPTYHHDPSEEFFFQVEGDMVLKTVQDGRLTDVPIREGEVFLLPAEVPHSPQRPAGSVGIVVERRRNPAELDGFSWYCEHCGHRLYLERVAVRNIETQLPEIFAAILFEHCASHLQCLRHGHAGSGQVTRERSAGTPPRWTRTDPLGRFCAANSTIPRRSARAASCVYLCGHSLGLQPKSAGAVCRTGAQGLAALGSARSSRRGAAVDPLSRAAAAPLAALAGAHATAKSSP